MENIRFSENNRFIYRFWLPENKPEKAVFLLVHGLGAHTGRWQFFGDFFARRGGASYALELKGSGETNWPVGHVNSFKIYYEDIKKLLDLIWAAHPGKKVFLVGESLGGLISFLMAAKFPDIFDGLVCFSPAFKNRMKFSLSEYFKFFLYLFFYPAKQFKMPFTSEMCTRDDSYQKIMNESWRETRLASSKMLWNIMLGQMFSYKAAGQIKMPVLFLLAGDDQDRLVDPPTAKKVFKSIKSKDKTIIQYPEMRHALSIELGREKVFEDILSWTEKRL